MAGHGPPPKAADQRRRRNAQPDMDVLPAEGYQGEFPKLPPKWRDQRTISTTDEDGVTTTKPKTVQVAYLKATRDWYEDWARSPMATRFTKVEWNRLLMLAPLIDQHHRRPSKETASEIRLQETLLGGTLMDRQRARLKISASPQGAPAGAGPPATVTRLRAVDPEK